MYELHQVTDTSYYIQSPAKIGLIRLDGNDVCLIDSGNDKEAGRKVRQILDANGWRLRAIFNTHSNADHIGGNKYLQTQTGCDIFAPGIEQRVHDAPHLFAAQQRRRTPAKEYRIKRGGITPAARNKLDFGEQRLHIAFGNASLGKADKVAVGALSHTKRYVQIDTRHR